MLAATTSGGATVAVSGSTDQNIENSSNVNGNSSSIAVVSYQRRHSHEEKSNNLDRPHIEEINQLQRRSSLDRKTFSILSVVELNDPGLTGYQWVNFAVTFSYLGPQKEPCT